MQIELIKYQGGIRSWYIAVDPIYGEYYTYTPPRFELEEYSVVGEKEDLIYEQEISIEDISTRYPIPPPNLFPVDGLILFNGDRCTEDSIVIRYSTFDFTTRTYRAPKLKIWDDDTRTD